jgi:hypothetical protein
MNPIDWWSLALVPGLAALGWSFKNALRLKAIERELTHMAAPPTPTLARVPVIARGGRPC